MLDPIATGLFGLLFVIVGGPQPFKIVLAIARHVMLAVLPA